MNAAVQVDPVLFADPPLFRVRPRPGADAVPEAVGELDQGTGGALDAAVDGALGAATAAGRLVLDMGGVRFCDSGGLNAVIRAHLRARTVGAVLHLVSPALQVAALLKADRSHPGAAGEPGPGCGRTAAGRDLTGATLPPVLCPMLPGHRRQTPYRRRPHPARPLRSPSRSGSGQEQYGAGDGHDGGGAAVDSVVRLGGSAAELCDDCVSDRDE